jgi:hypothetical protein
MENSKNGELEIYCPFCKGTLKLDKAVEMVDEEIGEKFDYLFCHCNDCDKGIEISDFTKGKHRVKENTLMMIR